jgi:hypothetical protein
MGAWYAILNRAIKIGPTKRIASIDTLTKEVKELAKRTSALVHLWNSKRSSLDSAVRKERKGYKN